MKQTNQIIKISLILSFLSFCMACSNQKVLKSQNLSLEKAYKQVSHPSHSYTNNSILKIEDSLSIFERFDDIDGQWLANYHLSNYWMSNNNLEKAQKFSLRAFKLAKLSKKNAALFKSTLQVAQLTNDSNLMQQSLKYTTDKVERALVLSHLNKQQQAYTLIKNDLRELNGQNNNSIAFVLFQYGRSNEEDALIQLSKDFYIKAENSNGVIDCLFWLAKFNFKKNNLILAEQFAYRAKKASSAIKNNYKTKKIVLWIDSYL